MTKSYESQGLTVHFHFYFNFSRALISSTFPFDDIIILISNYIDGLASVVLEAPK